jgi:hypothetical protein
MTPREIVDVELNTVRRMFDVQKEILPMAVFVRGTDHAMMPLMFNSDYEKDVASDVIRRIVKETTPDAVVYMAEAWTLNVAKNVPIKDLPRPSQSKDRVEIVAVTVEFKTGEKFSCMAKILREEGKVTLAKFDVSEDKTMMGRFADFYAPERTN